jgi:GTP cyclohydrolase I
VTDASTERGSGGVADGEEADGPVTDGAVTDGPVTDGATTPVVPARDGKPWSRGTDRPAREVDLARAAAAVRELLLAVGEDPDREGLLRTPERVAEMYAELLSGMREDPGTHLQVTFSADHDEMVMVRDIPFASLCEHHLVPFIGRAHVAYVPSRSGAITGLSKLARLVDGYARRLQVQEQLTTEIAEAMERALEPRGTLVVLEAEHLCMSMRGVRKPGALTVTSAVRGLFRTDVATRAEAMAFVRRSG